MDCDLLLDSNKFIPIYQSSPGDFVFEEIFSVDNCLTMINDELETQSLEEYSYPINDVLLSSSSDVINPIVMGPPAPPKTRSRTKRNPTKTPQPPAVSIPSSVLQQVPLEISGANIKHEPVPIVSADKNSKTQICSICNKSFAHAYALRKHLANHNSQVYNCNQCSKSFKHQNTLIAHKASHASNLPFTCEVCNKSFNRISTLKSHRRIHTGAKPFSCDVCRKAFYQKGNLKNHLHIHTNERPYRCEICNRGFNQMSNLVCHRKNAHRIANLFYCQYCDMKFTRADHVANHEMEMHMRPVNNINIAALETDTKLVHVETYLDSSEMSSGDPLHLGDGMQDIEVVIEDVPEIKLEEISEFEEPLPITACTEMGLMPEGSGSITELNPLNPAIEGSSDANSKRNCQMVFEKTENHSFFSKFSVIELPQKIDTLEMKYAEMSNKTPFAMLHFGTDAPCLVEIIQQKGMSILKPIKKHELGNFTFSEPDPADVGSSNKIVITIVATILQSYTKGEFSLFTVKSPEIVRCVKLLVDANKVNAAGGSSSGSSGGSSSGICAKDEELRELKNKITIAMSDCRVAQPLPPLVPAPGLCKKEPKEEQEDQESCY